MADDKTLRMVTNLDRAAIEGKLAEVRNAAQSANLAELAAMFAGQFAGAGDLHEVARAARAAPPPAGVPRPSDLLLDALAAALRSPEGALS